MITRDEPYGENRNQNRLTCRDNDEFLLLRVVEVFSLDFDPQGKSFSMTYCDGDDWGQVLRCPIATPPTSCRFHGDEVTIHFAQRKDADEFGDWVIEAEWWCSTDSGPCEVDSSGLLPDRSRQVEMQAVA